MHIPPTCRLLHSGHAYRDLVDLVSNLGAAMVGTSVSVPMSMQHIPEAAMSIPRTPKPLSPLEREYRISRREYRALEAASDEYDELFDAEIERRRAEWEEQFGSAFRFEPDRLDVHKVVMRQIEAMKQDD